MIAVCPNPPQESPATHSNAATSERSRRASAARAASTRRRLIDPTTCDRDYTPDELEFMAAMQRYKQQSGRMFPTWSEVLEVIQSLGYAKVEAIA